MRFILARYLLFGKGEGEGATHLRKLTALKVKLTGPAEGGEGRLTWYW